MLRPSLFKVQHLCKRLCLACRSAHQLNNHVACLHALVTQSCTNTLYSPVSAKQGLTGFTTNACQVEHAVLTVIHADPHMQT